MVQCGISPLAAAWKGRAVFGKVRGSSGRRSGTLKCVLPQEATLTFSCSPNQGFKKPQMLACHREKGIIEPSSGGDWLAVRTGRCHVSPDNCCKHDWILVMNVHWKARNQGDCGEKAWTGASGQGHREKGRTQIKVLLQESEYVVFVFFLRKCKGGHLFFFVVFFPLLLSLEGENTDSKQSTWAGFVTVSGTVQKLWITWCIVVFLFVFLLESLEHQACLQYHRCGQIFVIKVELLAHMTSLDMQVCALPFVSTYWLMNVGHPTSSKTPSKQDHVIKKWRSSSHKPKRRLLFLTRGVGGGLSCWSVGVLEVFVLLQWEVHNFWFITQIAMDLMCFWVTYDLFSKWDFGSPVAASHSPMTWQQLSAFRHADMVKRTSSF